MKLPIVCWGDAEDAALEESEPLDVLAGLDALAGLVGLDELAGLAVLGGLVVLDELDAALVSAEAPALGASAAAEVSDGVLLEASELAEEPAAAIAAAVDGSGPTPSCA